MKKPSNKLIIALALITIAGVVFYYENIKKYDFEIPTETIIVANENIPENTIVTENMIQKDTRYQGDILKQQDYIVLNEKEIIGKRTRVPIYKNEAIYTNRLIENELYMEDNNDEKKTQFILSIYNLDKALDIKKGSYIDIWQIPNTEGLLNGMKAEIMMSKLKVYNIKTESYSVPSKSNIESPEEKVVTYLTLLLTDKEIEHYLEMTNEFVDTRITLYGENLEYQLINDKIHENKRMIIDEINIVGNKASDNELVEDLTL